MISDEDFERAGLVFIALDAYFWKCAKSRYGSTGTVGNVMKERIIRYARERDPDIVVIEERRRR